jgi:hypothetical protein
MAAAWVFFDPVRGLLTEINSSLWRNQVEEYVFQFSVVEKLDPIMRERLTDNDYYEKNKWDQKKRTKELRQYEEKAAAK